MKFINLFFAGLAVLLAISCESEQVTIKVTVNSEMSLNGKWAYLFSLYGNQMDIIDSCRIRDGRFRLSGDIPQEEVMAQVMIPDKATYYLLVARGEKIKLHLDSTTRSYFPQSEGSFATSRMAQISKRYREIGYRHLDSLKQLLGTLPASDAWRTTVADSVDMYNQELNNLVHDAVSNKRSILLASVAKMWFMDSNPAISVDSMNRIIKSINERFPNSVHLASIDRSRQPARPTQSSIRAFNRKAQLTGEPLPYPEWQDEYKKPEKIADGNIPAYRMGDIVEAFALRNVEGNEVCLNDIVSDYVLIDFWASWCSPCRRDIPHLAEASRRYGDVLTVYAVSIDEDAEAWQKAVGELSISHFTNVRLAKEDSQFRVLVSKFDVRAIPHNFLLDENRKIIAIDLHGDELSAKLKELTEQ